MNPAILAAMARLVLSGLVPWTYLALAPAWADTVYLKNGNQMEGIVASESTAHVVLDFGYGTTTLRKDEILRIRRSSKDKLRAYKAEMSRRHFESGRTVPKGAEQLSKLVQNAQNQRERALEARSREQAQAQETKAIEEEQSQLKERFQAMSDELPQHDPNADGQEYNTFVSEMNDISMKIQANSYKLEKGRKAGRETDMQVREYVDAYHQLRGYLQGAQAQLLAKGEQDQKNYLAWASRQATKFGQDFQSDWIVSESRDNHLFVKAVINGRVYARLLVDTGASTTTLYQNTAASLKLSSKDILGVMKVQMADGRTVNAKAVRLRSLRVGNSKVQNTVAALIPSPAPAGFDGLLGMTFLKNFVVRVDGENKRLILEKMK